MTELTLTPAAGIAPQSQMVVDLQMWAAELSAAHSIGRALASTDFVPLSLKTESGGRPKEFDKVAENVAACILAGKALGLDPMNSIQNIFVVHGRPAMYARTMAALVLNAGHELERVAATERSVVYRGRRAGKTEWQTFEWTIERAQKAGYTSNKKYQTDPIAMLTAKCQSEAARVIAPDVLTGIASTSVEEVELEDLGEGSTAPAAATVTSIGGSTKGRTMRRQQPAAVAPAAVQAAPRETEPVDDEEAADKETGEIPTVEQIEAVETGNEPTDAEAAQGADAYGVEDNVPEQAPAADPAEPRCSTAQQKALGEALTAAGFPNKASMMLKVTQWAGRDIKASKELSESEAVALTAELWEEADSRQAAS